MLLYIGRAVASMLHFNPHLEDSSAHSGQEVQNPGLRDARDHKLCYHCATTHVDLELDDT